MTKYGSDAGRPEEPPSISPDHFYFHFSGQAARRRFEQKMRSVYKEPRRALAYNEWPLRSPLCVFVSERLRETAVTKIGQKKIIEEI